MEFSKYNIVVNDYPQKDYSMIYNLFTHKIICVKGTSEEWSTKLRNKMISQGFLVDNQVAQQNEVLRYYQSEVESAHELTIMLILTRKCNCKCVYCYEDQQMAQFDDMTDSSFIVTSIINLMQQLLTSNLKIIFYGGEPLLQKNVIYQISRALYNRLKERYSFSI